MLKNTSLVATTKDTTALLIADDALPVNKTISLVSDSNKALVLNTNTAATVLGGTGNNNVLVANDAAGTVLQAGTGIRINP